MSKFLKIEESNSGIYLLELFADSDFSISNPKFKNIIFPKGFYYYIGSAQKNLKSRVLRHISVEKKIHWHIDYLTTHKSLKIIKTFFLANAEKHFEAEIANNFCNYFESKIIVEGFGNSDTKETKSHLFFKNKTIPLSLIHKFYPKFEILNFVE